MLREARKCHGFDIHSHGRRTGVIADPIPLKIRSARVNYTSGYDPTPQIQSGYILCMLTLCLYILGHNYSDSPARPHSSHDQSSCSDLPPHNCSKNCYHFSEQQKYTKQRIQQYVTRSRKRGPFPQKSDCELDLPADSAKSVVHAHENRLTLARSVPKLQSFEYHTRAYLRFEISSFISVL